MTVGRDTLLRGFLIIILLISSYQQFKSSGRLRNDRGAKTAGARFPRTAPIFVYQLLVLLPVQTVTLQLLHLHFPAFWLQNSWNRLLSTMAPARTKKRKTSSENEPSARPQTVAPHSPARTPMRSPQKRIVSITEAQKQALIDNLQLEGASL